MAENTIEKPEILAPAGSRAAFLAAVAAGADAVYCGLKQFSARMAADNFTVKELSGLARLARKKQTRLYVAFNTIIKQDELDAAGSLIDKLNRHVNPDALIVTDTAAVSLACQAGFKGNIHLSTLANASFPSALAAARFSPRITRVVIPRELTVDEIRKMSDACPPELSLEAFVHGALCYAVSGRCYWSSYLGGKSGLRGNCVQPCRRMYTQGKMRARFFSCRDLRIDVLTKVLMTVPNISAFKIEGRKKGPHYVFYTIKAYRMLRDHPGDNAAKKAALECLEYAFGRVGTHYNFLTQRPWNPIDIESQTGSGQLVGKIQGGMVKPYIEPRTPLFAKDILRIGYEDEPWHKICRVTKSVPKRGRLFLSLSKKERPVNKTPVFLIDRREPGLLAEIEALENQMDNKSEATTEPSGFTIKKPAPRSPEKNTVYEVHVRRRPSNIRRQEGEGGLWLSPGSVSVSPKISKRTWWWLPPVIWPERESAIKAAINKVLELGFTRFVINAPWQSAFFPVLNKIHMWAGPFCNTANALAVDNLAKMGCSGVVASPELGKADYISLAQTSPLPLGIVVYGNWPLCISRIKAESLQLDTPFASPRKEHAWVCRHDENYWVYPEWPVDLRKHTEFLKKAGFRMFVHLSETPPAGFTMKNRPGQWNWEIGI